MPFAQLGEPVELLCPWCGYKATVAQAKALADSISLSDIGREKQKNTTCPSCSKKVGLFVKYIYYRITKIPE